MSDDDIRDNQILDLQDIVNNLKERISELEKELTTHRGAEVNTSNYLSGEIAELREKGKNHNDSIIELRSLIQSNAISDLNHYDVNQNQLNELKEQIKSQSKFWHILSEDMVIQRKVLREFVDEVGVNCYRTEFSGITDKEKTENAILYKKYLLEKLDGVGSASARESLDRQTEKKEIRSCIHFRKGMCSKDYSDWCENINCDRKDSGGEKAGSDSSSLNHPKDVRDGTLNQNSKPPELTIKKAYHFKGPRENDLSPIEYAFKSGQEYEREREDFPERVEQIKAMDRMIESDLGIKAITIKGNLYWMPKGEANDLISEFVKKLGDIIKMLDDPDDEVMVRELKEEYEEKLK